MMKNKSLLVFLKTKVFTPVILKSMFAENDFPFCHLLIYHPHQKYPTSDGEFLAFSFSFCN